MSSLMIHKIGATPEKDLMRGQIPPSLLIKPKTLTTRNEPKGIEYRQIKNNPRPINRDLSSSRPL